MTDRNAETSEFDRLTELALLLKAAARIYRDVLPQPRKAPEILASKGLSDAIRRLDEELGFR